MLNRCKKIRHTLFLAMLIEEVNRKDELEFSSCGQLDFAVRLCYRLAPNLGWIEAYKIKALSFAERDLKIAWLFRTKQHSRCAVCI